MAVYLYNLGFSVNNSMNGNFSSGGSGIATSNAWFQWNASGNPAGLSAYPAPLTTLGAAANWSLLTGPPASFNSGQTSSPDSLFLRIFNVDGTPANFLVRTTVIFGQGDSATPAINSPLQSPFVRNSSNQPMPVIDCDTAVFSITPPQTPNWPAVTTDVNPVTAASSWSYCLGQVSGPSNYYVFNVGASVYQTSGSGSGSVYAFGIDPRMRVSGGVGGMVADDATEDAA
jgi:hypothetical protein